MGHFGLVNVVFCSEMSQLCRFILLLQNEKRLWVECPRRRIWNTAILTETFCGFGDCCVVSCFVFCSTAMVFLRKICELCSFGECCSYSSRYLFFESEGFHILAPLIYMSSLHQNKTMRNFIESFIEKIASQSNVHIELQNYRIVRCVSGSAKSEIVKNLNQTKY